MLNAQSRQLLLAQQARRIAARQAAIKAAPDYFNWQARRQQSAADTRAYVAEFLRAMRRRGCDPHNVCQHWPAWGSAA